MFGTGTRPQGRRVTDEFTGILTGEFPAEKQRKCQEQLKETI